MTLGYMDLIDIYRTFHSKAAEYTLFSAAHKAFSGIDHIWGHETSLGKFKKIKIISNIFSNHNAMRLEISYKKKKKTAKSTEAKQYAVKQTMNNRIKEEITKYLEEIENKHNNTKSVGCSRSSSKREVYSDTNLKNQQQEQSQTT